MTRLVLCTLFVLAVACDDKAATPSPAAGQAAQAAADGFTEYQRKSKASEAKVRLKQIAMGARLAMTEERLGPDGKVAPPGPPEAAPMTPPAGACCKQPNHKCTPTPTDWQHPAWRALAFELMDPHYYSYALEPTADGFVAKAVGDLDCDGTLATYELRGTSKNGDVELAELTSTDPLE